MVHFLGLTRVDILSSLHEERAERDRDHPCATDILCVRSTLHNKVSYRLQLRQRIS